MKIRRRGKVIQEVVGAVVNKVLSKNEGIAQERLKVCEGCPLKAGPICSGCGCLIEFKIYSNENNCPEGFWEK